MCIRDRLCRFCPREQLHTSNAFYREYTKQRKFLYGRRIYEVIYFLRRCRQPSSDYTAPQRRWPMVPVGTIFTYGYSCAQVERSLGVIYDVNKYGNSEQGGVDSMPVSYTHLHPRPYINVLGFLFIQQSSHIVTQKIAFVLHSLII